MNSQEISLPDFDIISLGNFDDIDQKFYQKCFFCQKRFFCDEKKIKITKSISNSDNLFCNFCLRNGFYKKNKIFIFSFRNLLAHLYYQNQYAEEYQNKSFKKVIESHKMAGYENPLFLYDDETMLWFIDFSKVSKNKVNFKEIAKTIRCVIKSLDANSEFDSKLLFDIIKSNIKNKKSTCIPDATDLNIQKFNYDVNFLLGFSYKFVQ